MYFTECTMSCTRHHFRGRMSCTHALSTGSAELSKTSMRPERATSLLSTSERTTKRPQRGTKRSKGSFFRSWTRWLRSARLPPSCGGKLLSPGTVEAGLKSPLVPRVDVLLLFLACLLLLGVGSGWVTPSVRCAILVASSRLFLFVVADLQYSPL